MYVRIRTYCVDKWVLCRHACPHISIEQSIIAHTITINQNTGQTRRSCLDIHSLQHYTSKI